MSYKCLNCGHYSDDVNISADICSNRGCGFRVGRYEYDSDYSLPTRRSDPMAAMMGIVIVGVYGFIGLFGLFTGHVGAAIAGLIVVGPILFIWLAK